MKKISLSIMLIMLIVTLFPIIQNIEISKKYTYESEDTIQKLSFHDILEPSVNNNPKPSNGIVFWKQASGWASFLQEQNMIIFKIPKTFESTEWESNIRIYMKTKEKLIPLNIDHDMGEYLPEKYYYTEPIFTDNISQFSYIIETKKHIQIPFVQIVGLDIDSHTLRMSIWTDITQAEDTAIRIISRSEWGADETLRYRDNPLWQKAYEKIEKDVQKSDAALQYEQKIKNIRTYLAENFPDQDRVIETKNTENGRPLVWPIEKTKQVERIIVHHTAENNQSNRDDLALIRGIYYYHTIVRGWGDIGYNYLVGQRGDIYEGRAWGDYSIGAHAVWNNKSTVGVSVMGNFMIDSVVAEQEQAVKNVIEHLSKKYGIDIHRTSMGHKECKKNDCLLEDFKTPNLIGHKEVGFTSCPWENLFTVIENIRTSERASIGRSMIINPNTDSIQIASLYSRGNIPLLLNKWPLIRVKLSYTGSTIRLKSGDSSRARLTIGDKSGILKKNPELLFEAVSKDKVALIIGKKKYAFPRIAFEANLVEIPSWDRKPSWDKTWLMNDNIFRAKISLENDGGKLVVVNELPLEDYLRGLAEVSNGDNEEKIKTILVAARSYAYFYSKPENRKFPGKNYDGSDNPDEFQKYLGYGYEKRSPRSIELVDTTNGQLITYQGNVIKPWYFNESNGQTLSAKQYCENRVKNWTLPLRTQCPDIPYLQSVSDPGWVGRTQKWHGVGISGIGATYLALNLGFSYDQIIQYYLDGVMIEKKY
jgi:hypothetical protein